MVNKKRIIIQSIFFILYIGLIIFFTVECLKSAEESTKSSNVVVEVVAKTVEVIKGSEVEITEKFSNSVRKIVGHFGYFAALSIISAIFYLLFKKSFWIYIHFSVGIAFALISEFVLEGSAKGRGPSFTDVMIDLGGFALGSLITLLIFFLYKYKKKKRIEKNQQKS